VKFIYDARLIGFYNIYNSQRQETIINLSDADLSGADFVGVNLAGANLHWAKLRGADFYGADLNGADLRVGPFTLFTQDQLDQAFLCNGAILPPGLFCRVNRLG